MSLITSFVDSFNQYTQTSDLLYKWDSISGAGGSTTWADNYGRNGTGGVLIGWTESTGFVKALNTPISDTIPIQWGFNFKGVGPSTLGDNEFAGLELTTSSGAWNVLFGNNLGQTFLVNNDLNLSHGQTYGTQVVNDNSWHWSEFAVLFNTSAGYVRIYTDGILDVDYNGPTCNAVPTTLNSINLNMGTIISGQGHDGCYLSDFYYDATGNLSWPIGPSHVDLLLPNANGDIVQFTPSSGANYQCVNQGFASSAYVSDASTGNEDLYKYNPLSDNPFKISMVVGNYFAENSGTGTANLIGKIKTGSATASGATVVLPVSNPQNIQQTFYTDANSAAWTPATVNALQLGQGD